MSDDADPLVETLARQMQELSAEDRELVSALVARLLRSGEEGAALGEYPRDVSFMDFDQ